MFRWWKLVYLNLKSSQQKLKYLYILPEKKDAEVHTDLAQVEKNGEVKSVHVQKKEDVNFQLSIIIEKHRINTLAKC